MSLAAAMRSCEFLRPGGEKQDGSTQGADGDGRFDGSESVVTSSSDDGSSFDDDRQSDGAVRLDDVVPTSETDPDVATVLGEAIERVRDATRAGTTVRSEDNAHLEDSVRSEGDVRSDDAVWPEVAVRAGDAVLTADLDLTGAAALGVDLDRIDDTVRRDDPVRAEDAVLTADSDQTGASVFDAEIERIGDSLDAGFDALTDGDVFELAEHERMVVCADQAPPFEADVPDSAVHVDEPGELIAAVPAMIGFPPERSLVVLVLRSAPGRGGGAIIDAVVRFDLDQDGGRRRLRAGMVAKCVMQICAHDDVAEVLAVVVDDRAVEPTEHRSEIGEQCGTGRFEVLIDALDRRLAAHDIALAGAWAVCAIEAEEGWWSLLGPDRRGALPDPATSVVALSNVLDGKHVRGSRAELTAMVVEDIELQDQVASLLDSAVAVARDRYARAVRRGDPSSYSREALDYVLWQIANTESGGQLMVPEIAELAAALRDRAVRDTMFALAVGDHAVAAEGLWAALTRALTGRDRAEAAALLGYSAYVRGDGPLAGIALDAALDADPDHPLATLLETSLHLGMRPDQLRRLARSGYDTAADLGIDLGSPAP